MMKIEPSLQLHATLKLMCLSEMAYTAGFCSLKDQFFLWALLLVVSESVSNNFGFIWCEKGEIFWKETSKGLQKTGTILQLRDHG